MSRNASNGRNELEGDFLMNAQGEDVVAGIRMTEPISELKAKLPEVYDQFREIAHKLEQHYRNMQDMEFTIERGTLWILQTRDGKRTAQAEVRIAVEMVAFNADTAERWAKQEEKKVIIVRLETKPDDMHGMLAAEGILTSKGGRTIHAALLARQLGKPAVVGVSELELDLVARKMEVGGDIIEEGDWICLDGTLGEVYLGQLPTVVPDIKNPGLIKLLELGG